MGFTFLMSKQNQSFNDRAKIITLKIIISLNIIGHPCVHNMNVFYQF
jgi:hypothetical protein